MEYREKAKNMSLVSLKNRLWKIDILKGSRRDLLYHPRTVMVARELSYLI